MKSSGTRWIIGWNKTATSLRRAKGERAGPVPNREAQELDRNGSQNAHGTRINDELT
jgi:hypothetical protein